jgi:hypothetical protein
LGWTGDFGFRRGPFAHWQFWLLLSIILQLTANLLTRYGDGEATAGLPRQRDR